MHLNIRGVLQAIFGYTAAVTPFANHILNAWDKDMQLAIARKVGIRIVLFYNMGNKRRLFVELQDSKEKF